MTAKKKVVYYNMPGDLSHEEKLLKQWGITDLELVQVNGNNLLEDVKEADSLTLEYTEVSADTLRKLPNLKIIALQSIGTNEIDIDAADKEGIYVTNTPAFCAYEVASHAMALLLNLSRKVHIYSKSVKEGAWDASIGGSLSKLKGKNCGLVSLGSIPRALIPMLKGFGINMYVYSSSTSKEEAERLGISKCDSLDELLNISDILSLHSPLLPNTQGMINEHAFAQMKEGVILINTARGELIDETALIKNLKSNKVAAAGLDVLADEKKPNRELIAMDNVIVTPHMAFLSKESLLESKRISLEQVVTRLSKNQTPEHIVNKNFTLPKH
ncbi:C-terminal binding protein [Marinomonas sp. 5E14-1]|uniref:C-terminal binding protein n=1 Tax=Marinomonas sp. 5E14-1 TaxID=3153922 RepID=UPI003266A84A